jgi:thiamine-phosphate pyrophosphorylase
MKLHALIEDLETAGLAMDGGATVIQLRLKGRPTEEVVNVGRPIRELCRNRLVAFVVNDDVEAALELDADGVHLGRGDSGAALALRHGLLLGLSATSLGEAISAEQADAAYIGAGPVWATSSKEDADPPIGVEGLKAICEAVSVPVIAIGAIDAENAGDCIRAGARGVAVIRAARDAARLRAAIDAAL